MPRAVTPIMCLLGLTSVFTEPASAQYYGPGPYGPPRYGPYGPPVYTRATVEFIGSHGLSLDWILAGDVRRMIAHRAANSERAASLR
jgi:hypothetical protein